MTIEERLYTDYQPFSLLHVGMAAFVDTGKMFNRDASNEPDKWLTGVGFGLRLVSKKSDKGQVVHLDIAYPVDRDQNGKRDIQFVAEVKKSL